MAWPLVLLATLLALAAWRVAGDEPEPRTGDHSRSNLVERRFDDVRLEVPRSWVVLDRSTDHVTWGEPDRAHTVTLASTAASTLPLPGVVAALVERSADELPGAEVVDTPRAIDLRERAARGDSAMLTRFRVNNAGTSLDIVQVWRRDSRAELDVVATWTSADGEWPASPRSSIPRAAASG
jgi:hypothetical protein